QGLKALRELLGIETLPVPHTRTELVARSTSGEPAGVEDEILQSQRRRVVGEAPQQGLIEITADAEPMIVAQGRERGLVGERGADALVDIAAAHICPGIVIAGKADQVGRG